MKSLNFQPIQTSHSLNAIRTVCVKSRMNVGEPDSTAVHDFVNRLDFDEGDACIFVIRFDSANCVAAWFGQANQDTKGDFVEASRTLVSEIENALRGRFKAVVAINLCTADMRIPLAKVSTVLGRSIAGQSKLMGTACVAEDVSKGKD